MNEKTMKPTYLVTGAAGFLGSHVCSELLERGDSVRALVLAGDPATKYIPREVEVTEGNLCDPDSLEAFFSVLEGTGTVVIHCASMVTTNPDFNQKLLDVNVGGTKNIIEKCLRHKECQKMVYVSSTGAIPELPKGQRITETDQFVPIDEKRQVGCYSQSKALATQEVLDACRNRGLNACVVHPSGILGPNDHAISETTGTIIKIMNGQMSVGMGGSFNLCDVRDLAHGCVMAADRGRAGECYILGNEEVTLKEVCKMLRDACGCKMPYFYVPIKMAYLLAAQMEKKAKKTGEKPLMTNFAVYNLARNNAFDYSKAKRELGYHTRPYAETLADEARWLVSEGYIKGVTVPNVPDVSTEPRDTIPATVSIEKGMLTHEEVDNLRKLLTGRDFIKAVANVHSVEELDRLASQHGFHGYTDEMLQECYTSIALSQKPDTVQELFHEKDFGRCSQKLALYGIATSRENFDRINDIVALGQNEELFRAAFALEDTVQAVELLQEHGYNAISVPFIEMLRENVSSLVADGMLTKEELQMFAGRDFSERCRNSLNILMAMSTVTELALHLEDAVNPAFMIAIAGGHQPDAIIQL